MEEIISKCGFRCDLCLAYYKNIDKPGNIEKLKYGWSKYFNINFDPTGLHCEGCASLDKDAKVVDSGCPVRPCAIEKGYKTCAECGEYICDKLKTRACAYKPVLEKFPVDIPADDFEIFIKPYQGDINLDEIRSKN
jgi:hypothetical protein